MIIDRSQIRRILVRSTNWVGDVVMTLPALDAIRETFPASTIAVLAKPWVVPLLESHPSVDQVISYDKGEGFPRNLLDIIRAVGVIRRHRFDLAILFQNAFEAALLAYLGGIRYRIGYHTDGRRALLSHAVNRDEDVLKQHQVEYYLFLLRAMGWRAESTDPRLHVDQKCRASARSLLQAQGIKEEDFLLLLSPGAIYGSAKRWPPERFALIGDWAAERWGAKVGVMGSKGEREICTVVCRGMNHPVLNLSGATTLGEAMALIERCQFFVTNDSGLMHIAAALNVPMVAIFGSTDPVATGPRSRKARVIRRAMDCSPCLKPECPGDYRCLRAIQPGEVWKEMESLRSEEK